MTKQDIDFIKRANKFIVIKDDTTTEFDKWADAVNYYNDNINNVNEIELSAICGMVAKTIAYKYM